MISSWPLGRGYSLLGGPPANFSLLVFLRHLVLSPSSRPFGRGWRDILYCSRPLDRRCMLLCGWSGTYVWRERLLVRRLLLSHFLKIGCSRFSDFASNSVGSDEKLWRAMGLWKTHTTIWLVIFIFRRLKSWCCSSWTWVSSNRVNNFVLSFDVALSFCLSFTTWGPYCLDATSSPILLTT